MSRVGEAPISLPADVKVDIDGTRVTVSGPRGTLTQSFSPDIVISRSDGVLSVSRPTDQGRHRALHGLTRALLANMVTGVSQGFEKSLELVGVGYRVQQSGEAINLQVGYSHPVLVTPMPGTQVVVEGVNRMHVRGADKQAVGEMAAKIRRIRPPNRYTGKGVRYVGEVVKLKPGKAAARKA